MGHIIAVTGDHHVNSTVGLCPPTFTLDDGGRHLASDRQRWIWAQWIHFWTTVAKVKKQAGWPVTAILLGELADDLGHKHKTTQLITNNINDIMEMAMATLKPIQETADQIVVLRGTEAHSGLSACLDEALAKQIGAVGTTVGTSSWWQYRARFEDVVIDAAHHPGAASRVNHTSGNEANRLAGRLFYEYSIENILRSRRQKALIPWPNLVLRGHNHKPADSMDNQPGGHPDAAIRAIITPSWQFGTSFGYQIAGGQLPIGGLIITVNGSKMVVNKIFAWPSPGIFPSADGWDQSIA